MSNGVATTDLISMPQLDELIGNREGTTARVSMDQVSAAVGSRIGVTYETAAEIEGDLDWPEGTIGTVWNDPQEALRGAYRKIGAIGDGEWTRVGEAPLGVALKFSLDRASEADQSALRAELEAIRSTAQAGLADEHRIAAAAARDQSALNAIAAGAPLVTTVQEGIDLVADGAYFQVMTERNLQLHKRQGNAATALGFVGRIVFDHASDLAYLTYNDVAPGYYIEADGQRYQVAEPDAADWDLDYTDSGGVKLQLHEWAADATALGIGSDVAKKRAPYLIRVPLKSSAAFNAADALANTNILNAVISKLPDGGYFEVLPADGVVSVYSLDPMDKTIHADWGAGNAYEWDSTRGSEADYISDTPSPAVGPFFFVNRTTVKHDLTVSIAKDTLSIAVPSAVASSLTRGDSIYLTSSDREMYSYGSDSYEIGEANVVTEISGTTITLGFPTSFAYTTDVTLEVLPEGKPTVRNGRFRELSTSARYGGLVGQPEAPDMFKFQNCSDFDVRDVDMENLNLCLVVPSGCARGYVFRCNLRSCQRPIEGGHGNLCKIGTTRYSRNVEVTRSEANGARHLVDFTRAHDCVSSFNYGIGGGSPYTWHGFSSIRCYSISDRHIGGVDSGFGWSVGREQFGPDHDVRIIDPQSTAPWRMFYVQGEVRGFTMEGGNCVLGMAGGTPARIAQIALGAEDVVVDGLKVRLAEGAVVQNEMFYLGRNDDGNHAKNVSILNGRYQLKDSMEIVGAYGVRGYLDVSGNKAEVLDSTACPGVSIKAGMENDDVPIYVIDNQNVGESGRFAAVEDLTSGYGKLVESNLVLRPNSAFFERTPIEMGNVGRTTVAGEEFRQFVAGGANSNKLLSVDSTGHTYRVYAFNQEGGGASTTTVHMNTTGTPNLIPEGSSGTDAPVVAVSGSNIVLSNPAFGQRELRAIIEQIR